MTTRHHYTYQQLLFGDHWPFQFPLREVGETSGNDIVILPPGDEHETIPPSADSSLASSYAGITVDEIVMPSLSLDPEESTLRFTGAFRGVRSLGSVCLLTGGGLRDFSLKGVLMPSASAPIGVITPAAEGSTSMADELALECALDGSFESLFDRAMGETFFDGGDSQFNQDIAMAIEVYGDVAVRSFHKALTSHADEAEVIEEALRSIGLIEDVRTHHSRLAILVSELHSENPRTRDAASVGIASMDDPAAIPSIEQALQNEQSELLKASFQSALRQLRETNDDLIAASQKGTLVDAP